jgi:chitodextrinase
MQQFLQRQSTLSKRSVIVFAAVFAALGTILLIGAKAAGNSTISGTAFMDTNRNGVMDTGEQPLANQHLFFFQGDGTYLTNTYTDAAGGYSLGGLDDGNYTVQYAPDSWWTIRNDNVPDTTGSLYPKINLQLAGTYTANFGWRPVVRSTVSSSPISLYNGPNGIAIKSYDDVVTAQDVYTRYVNLNLIGPEAPKTTIRFDFAPTASTSSAASSSNGGPYDSFSATSNISYLGWLDKNGELSHEYGHAWSLYNAYISQQDPTMTGYIQARGLTGDSRLNTSYAWNVREMIAEDYRQLFGIADEQGISQLNKDVPLAKDVPGLKDFLQNTFTKATSTIGTGMSAPVNLSASASNTAEGVSVALKWGASTGGTNPISRYDIYRGGQLINFVNNPATTFTDLAVLANTSYSYYVKAVDSAGTATAASNTVSIITPSADTVAPSAPSSLHSTLTTKTSVSLAWSASTDNIAVASYQIYTINTAKGKQISSLMATVNGTSYNIAGLKSNTSYSYYAVAVDNSGNKSAPSTTFTVKTSR